mgnify:CR=1 FL=1
MAEDNDSTIRELRRKLREANKPGPVRARVNRVIREGAPAYVGGVSLGAAEELLGPQTADRMKTAYSVGGMALLGLLNPEQDSVLAIAIEGMVQSGNTAMGIEHGKTVGRVVRVKRAMAQNTKESASRTAADAQLDEGAESINIVDQMVGARENVG